MSDCTYLITALSALSLRALSDLSRCTSSHLEIISLHYVYFSSILYHTLLSFFFFFFFFNDTATTEIYTLSLHDALPICPVRQRRLPGGARPDAGRTAP